MEMIVWISRSGLGVSKASSFGKSANTSFLARSLSPTSPASQTVFGTKPLFFTCVGLNAGASVSTFRKIDTALCTVGLKHWLGSAPASAFGRLQLFPVGVSISYI
jgi:hypothetical protein